MDKWTAALDRTLMILSVVLAGGSVLLFVFMDNIRIVDLGLSAPGALVWNTILAFVFFLQHSAMVRKGFRTRMAERIPLRYHGAIYSIASGVALTLYVVFYQRSGIEFFRLEGPALWIARTCSLLAILAFAWAIRALGSFDPFGLRPIKAHLHGRSDEPLPFVVRGPYRWVRHPLYFCVLVMIWASPEITAERLLLGVLWTAWIVVGTILEERDLVADFGDEYRGYQRKVPMLIPWRGRVQA